MREDPPPAGNPARDDAKDRSPAVQEALELFRGEVTDMKLPEEQEET